MHHGIQFSVHLHIYLIKLQTAMRVPALAKYYPVDIREEGEISGRVKLTAGNYVAYKVMARRLKVKGQLEELQQSWKYNIKN
jgi:hypothetical protein